ncbi:DUF6963 family protein [Microvirga roseola]|uniref:DUF6963 family protein n=1 Tax=Microvirga roseola TaxID=2883126 RepID=UPI001E61D9AB|nr:hypothetical protein [Microvirga roseola]
MTIGVAASGENAGAAVHAAVLGAELLGRGAIGGFAVFAMLDEQGRVWHRVTQRGGIEALKLPKAWLLARNAAAISSGPDRPEPLEQYLPGLDGIGLVTGHRLPNSPDANGIPLNRAVLAHLSAGEAPQPAVESVLAQSPEVDAGLIAMDVSGRIGFGNSARVARRADCGGAERASGRSHIALLHNSIFSQGCLAEKLADLAWSFLTGESTDIRLLFMRDSVPVHFSTKDRVHVSADGTITAVESANLRLQSAHRRATAIYLGSEIWQEGQLIGQAATELFTEVSQGRLCKQAGGPPIPIIMEAVRAGTEPPHASASQLIWGGIR